MWKRLGFKVNFVLVSDYALGKQSLEALQMELLLSIAFRERDFLPGRKGSNFVAKGDKSILSAPQFCHATKTWDSV